MFRTSIYGCSTILILCVAAAVHAEQQVTMQSGATIVGEVSMEGTDLTIDVAGAKIRVPMKDVATVTSVANDKSSQSQRLLMKGLEAQLLYGGEEQDLGLLAEAHRMAPDDARIAFWYARSLVNAGNGIGANQVFEPRREAILAVYPGIADRLANQIAERLAFEKLPSELVARLDQIATAAEQARPVDSQMTSYAAYFRLVDQADEPIDRSAFRVSGPGDSVNLESFANGYYLYTFNRRNGFESNPCQLEMIKPDLVSDMVEFNGSFQGAENVGVLRVKRLNDTDRRPVVVSISDPAGKPLAGARVAITVIGRAGSHEGSPPVTTTAEGTAQLKLFPNDYICQITLENYAPYSQRIVVAADEKQAVEIDAKLYRAISATIKAVWQAKSVMHPGMPQFQDGAVTSGEFEQRIGPNEPGGIPRGPFGRNWVQLVQVGDEVKLQFMDQMNFPQAEAPWVGRWKRTTDKASEDPENSEDDADVFDMLELAQLNEIKNEIQLERANLGGLPGRGGPMVLPVEAGDIYLGKLSSQDPQSGRPAVIEFKILATELTRP